MKIHRTYSILITLMLLLCNVGVMASDYFCAESDSEYFGLTVHNHTDGNLLIDLGMPTHGWADYDENGNHIMDEKYNRYVHVPAHSNKLGVLCSGGWWTGLESYVRLYRMPGKHYLEEWYVVQPHDGMNTIHYTNDTGTCEVQYYTAYWDHYYQPHFHPSDWHEMPSLVYNHSHIEEVVVWCR